MGRHTDPHGAPGDTGWSMKRGEHLPIVLVSDTSFEVVCNCQLRFRQGDTYPDMTRTGKPVTRTIRKLSQARDAHRIHYLSDLQN